MSQVQIISGPFLAREIAENNEELLLVTGAALFPSLFGGLVSVSPVDGGERAVRCQVIGSDNAYVLHLRDLARIALDFARGTGNMPEDLRESGEGGKAAAPEGLGEGRSGISPRNVLSFSRELQPRGRR